MLLQSFCSGIQNLFHSLRSDFQLQSLILKVEVKVFMIEFIGLCYMFRVIIYVGKEQSLLEEFSKATHLWRGTNKGVKICYVANACSCFRLSLEWNNIGTNEDAFKELCEGLVMNASLQYLDLRSNNISPNGTIHLATAFLSNRSLLEVGMLNHILYIYYW